MGRKKISLSSVGIGDEAPRGAVQATAQQPGAHSTGVASLGGLSPVQQLQMGLVPGMPPGMLPGMMPGLAAASQGSTQAKVGDGGEGAIPLAFRKQGAADAAAVPAMGGVGTAAAAAGLPQVPASATATLAAAAASANGLEAPGSQFLTPEERSHPMVAALAAMNAQIQMSQMHFGTAGLGAPAAARVSPISQLAQRDVVEAINQDVDARMPDPDITELFDHFHLDTRHLDRFRRAMDKRKDTFAGDMIKIWELLEQARSPEGMLVSKIKEIEDGIFVGKTVPDAELMALSKKYRLDNEAESKLSDVLAKYGKERRQEYMKELDQHLAVSSRPSAMVMMSLRKLGEGQSLGKPGKAALGSYAERQSREDRDDRRKGGGDRDRDDRGRDDRRGDDRRGDDRRCDDRRGDRDRDRGDRPSRSERDRSRGDRRDRSRERRDRDRSRDRQRGGDRDRSRSRDRGRDRSRDVDRD